MTLLDENSSSLNDEKQVEEEVFSDKILATYVPANYEQLLPFLTGYESEVLLRMEDLKSTELFYAVYLWTLQLNGRESEIKNILADIKPHNGGSVDADLTVEASEVTQAEATIEMASEDTDSVADDSGMEIETDASSSAVTAAASSAATSSAGPSPLTYLANSKLIGQTAASIDAIDHHKFDVIPEISRSYPWTDRSPSLATLVQHTVRSFQDSIYSRIVTNYVEIRTDKLRLFLGISANWDDDRLLTELNAEHSRQHPSSSSKWQFKSPLILIPPTLTYPASDSSLQLLTQNTTKLQTLIDLANHLEAESL